jgi:DNA-binding CsgD family transcriptional regulator
MVKPDPIALVEAAYDLEACERVWLQNLVERAISLVPEARRATAFTIDASNSAAPQFGMPVNLGFGPTFDRLMLETMRADGATILRASRRKVGTLTEAIGTDYRISPMAGVMIESGFGSPDSFVGVALDAEGRGLVIATDLPRTTRLSRSLRSRWELIGSHLAAARRLREVRTVQHDAECILVPGGHVVHAEGDAKGAAARERLREAVVARDRARQQASRAQPDEALASWPGLVSRRWSLIDRFERDGRRYVVARRNEPRPSGPLALTLRERQVLGHMMQGDSTKLIAYSLGLAPSTVSAIAGAVRLKLGTRNPSMISAL